MKPVAIVQHERSVPPGHVARVLRDDGVDHFVIDAARERNWPSVTDVGALVVLGGTMNVDQLDDYPFLQRSRELMNAAMEQDLPVLGLCLGAQMMARVLGEDVRRATPRNALFSPLELTDEGRNDPLMAPFAPGIPVLQFHEDTFTVPSTATALASSTASGLALAFRHGERAYAIQFHFEVDPTIVNGWIGNIGSRSMDEDWGCPDGGRSLAQDGRLAQQAKAGEELVRRFVQLRRSPGGDGF